MRKTLLIIIFSILLCAPVFAGEATERQFKAIDVENFTDALPPRARLDAGGEADAETFWDRAAEIIHDVLEGQKGLLRSSAAAAAKLLLVILFCSALEMLLGEEGRHAVILLGVIALFIGATADVKELVGAGVQAINELHSFSLLLLPVISGACAAAGQVSASAA